MKEIFDKIIKREDESQKNLWNHFGNPYDTLEIGDASISYDEGQGDYPTYSLPDLLANKSWCIAVWGLNETYASIMWIEKSQEAFSKLQWKGQKACLDYIKSTMI